jgi:hypothetical protein
LFAPGALGYKGGMLCISSRVGRAVTCAFAFASALTCTACDESNGGSDAVDADTSHTDAGADAGSADAAQEGGAVEGGAVEDACELNPPATCPTPIVRFADIEPILKERCIGCHDGKGEQWPLVTYNQVASWYDHVRDLMLTCAMPPKDSGIRMPAAEREKLITWVRCGYMQ